MDPQGLVASLGMGGGAGGGGNGGAGEASGHVPGGVPGGPSAARAGADRQAGVAHERAGGCVWLADDSIMGPLYARVKHLLPQMLPGGCRLAGINCRWRLYRYQVQAPHVAIRMRC